MIYLDNSATTKIDPKVLKDMQPYLEDQYGNASSLHQLGLDSRVAVDRAQAKIARFLNCDKKEVYFTSGSTESDNMAILGLTRAIQKAKPKKKLHIITSVIEHDAILESCRQAELEGVEVTYIPVNKSGIVNVKELFKAIKSNTVLISLMYVNNEVGTIFPLSQIGQRIKNINKTRRQKIYFHTDATQAPAYCNCDVLKLNADLLSLSGHKIYGPKGIGVIYVRDGVTLEPLMFGGHQQDGVRSGTFNTPGIVGLGVAVDLLTDKVKLRKENKRIKLLRDYLVCNILKNIEGAQITGDITKKVPSNASFIFKGVEGESVLLMLSEAGIAVSTGSACSSGSLEPSTTLTAMGISPELAHGSIRITLGRFTTKAEITKIARLLPGIIKRLRSISPLK
jgi:cysteine desulfurase